MHQNIEFFCVNFNSDTSTVDGLLRYILSMISLTLDYTVHYVQYGSTYLASHTLSREGVAYETKCNTHVQNVNS